ncbi:MULTISPECIES: rRNA maturation RNase YbeY [unclassified Bdellovibrio]|uniref:rRNA maturation RNase YbeY n=1 Tax=unclassified Bdellovibrio TaxID=2633795 RepID=UPI00115BE107|nr:MULTISPECIES: rRNA maturation RNase YbeY [unclassified Bdellovibrio]QDK45092.1 rRNA maturation RNase YbeY [Bdellovibrio sp. ZAP7]QLY26799.1 rRNA maturation RNase YbeY [Bdellovibrio sp. KM01]
MQVLIINESKHTVPRKFIQEWMDQVVAELKKRKVLNAEKARRELTLVFLDKKPAQKINNEFRGKDYATDVLSFDSMDPSSFGELILCPEVLKKQAKEHKLTFQKELGYMLLHGTLHLLGYDHETNEKDAKKMFDLQDAIFERLLRSPT